MVDSLKEKRKTDPQALDFATYGQLEEAQNPFEEEQVTENPFDDSLLVNESPFFDNENALRFASIDDNDPISSYGQALQKGGLWSVDQINQSASKIAFDSVVTAVENMSAEGNIPEPEVIKSVLEEDEAMFISETGPERAWASHIDGFDSLDEGAQESIIAERYVQRKIAEIIDKSSWYEIVGDMAGIFVIPDESYNAGVFYSHVTGNKEGFENYMNSADKLHQIGDWFFRLSPKEKVATLPILLEAAEKTDDNSLQQAFMLWAATGQEEYERTQFDHLFDKATVAGAGGKLFSNILKTTGITKSLFKADEGVKASAVIDSVVKGDIRPDEGQIHALDAASSSLPIVSDNLDELLDAAPAKVATEIRDSFAKADAINDEAMNFIQEGLNLTPADVQRVVERETKRLEKLPNIENVKTVKVKDDSVEFSFDVSTSDGLTRDNAVVRFTTQDVVDGFDQKEVTTIGDMLSGVVSPNKLFKGDREVLVQSFERVANAQAKIKAKLTDNIRLATSHLSDTSRKKVQVAIQRGDADGMVYDYQTLVNEGIGSFRLDDKEYKSYMQVRKVLDDMYFLKEKEIRTGLETRGVKTVDLGIGQSGFSSISQDAATAYKRYEVSDFKGVYDDASGEIISLSRADLDEAYDSGLVLTKLDSTNQFWEVNSTKAKWALVSRENVSELPDLVLNYRPGYAPRVYDDAYWFVKAKESFDDMGNPVSYPRTLRYFDNNTDASTWAQTYAKENGISPEDVNVVFNREPIGDPALEGDIINMFGGLFASPRKDEALKFGLNGENAKLKDPLEAIQQYTFHLGNRLPITQLRLGLEQKWMNDVAEFTGKHTGLSFNDSIEVVKSFTSGDPKKRKMLLKAHEQISTLNHIPTIDEQILQGKFTSVGKSLEEFSPALKGMAKAMYSLNQTSPVAAVKAATHHMLLGTFSMAQFPVQALGATIAMSINPTYAAKGMGKWLALSYLDNIKDPAIKAAQLKKLSKVKGLGLEDIEDTYRLWNRSGYRDSVLITNGDYASIANGLPYDGNVVKRLFDKGTFFFKAGEMANMRISFATSLERWKDLNKGKKLDDKALKEIFARSEQFRLNMSQGNRARFQKGVISIPLQFQQINTKFLEAVTPGSAFTGRERMNLAVGQGVLFGSIGIPFGQQITSWLLDTADIDTSDMSAEQLNLLKRGITGWVLNNQLDVDAELSGRVAVAGGVSDAIIDAIFEKHSILGVLGPTGSIGERFWNGPLDILMNANKLRVSADKLDTNQIGLIAENLLWSLGEIPSSTRNAIIAWDLWKSGMVRGSNGQVMWINDPGLEDVVFQAMGFQSVDRQEFWELIKSGKAQQEAEKALLDRLSRTYMRLNRSLESKDYEGANNAAYTVAVLANYLDDPAQQSKLTKQLINRFKADEEATKIVEKLMKNSSDFTSSSRLRLNLLHQEAIAPREE